MGDVAHRQYQEVHDDPDKYAVDESGCGRVFPHFRYPGKQRKEDQGKYEGNEVVEQYAPPHHGWIAAECPGAEEAAGHEQEYIGEASAGGEHKLCTGSEQVEGADQHPGH